MNCSRQDFIRAINGTLQTRIPHRSIDPNENFNRSFFDEFNENYFDSYAFDAIKTLTYLNEIPQLDQIDFVGATVKTKEEENSPNVSIRRFSFRVEFVFFKVNELAKFLLNNTLVR